MLVFFSGSSVNLDEHLPYVETIRSTVYDLGADFSDEWLGPAIASYKKGNEHGRNVNWQQAHEHNMDQMSKSDAVIIEATTLNLPLGFYIAKALESKKPTLVVERHDLRTQLISGIKEDLLTVQQYTSHDELRSIVANFIEKYRIGNDDLYVNLKISREVYRFLRSSTTDDSIGQAINSILEQRVKEGCSSTSLAP